MVIFTCLCAFPTSVHDRKGKDDTAGTSWLTTGHSNNSAGGSLKVIANNADCMKKEG